MPEHRRRFSPQFKAEAVQMVIETGKPIAEVARDLGIHDGTLGNWVNAWRREHPEPDQSLSPVERARVSELEEECRLAGVLVRAKVSPTLGGVLAIQLSSIFSASSDGEPGSAV
jgi:transposase